MAGLAALVTEEHYARGWHATSTLGTMGAAVAVTRALGGNIEQVTRALAIGASLASGIRANFGTMTKPLHAGAAARSGIDAALLALGGLTANANVLESAVGVASLFAGPSVLAGRSLEDVGREMIAAAERALDDISAKRYPCCGGSHFGIDAALDVRQQLGGDFSIETVEVEIPGGARTALIHDDPSTGLEGKFSLPYTVATSLVYGVPTLGRFTDEAVYDPQVRAVMESLAINEQTTGPSTAGSLYERWASVRVTTTDGRSAVARVTQFRGTPERPLTAEEIDEKFLDCVSRHLQKEDAVAYLAACRALPTATSLRGLVDTPFVTA